MKPSVSRIVKRPLSGLLAGLLLALPSARCQELLKDPGFEQSTPNGTFPDSAAWEKAWLFEAGAVCSTTAAFQGSSGLWQYTGSTRSSWWAGQFQEFEVPPDCVFTAVAWARTPPGEGWVDGSLAAVRIEYYLNDGQRLTFDSAQANDAGAYAVTITNAEGASTSESATLTVLDQSGPVLELTHIPGYGTGENLEGRGLNVPPSLAKVACAVGVPAIWTKPTFANPSVPIQPDGSWVADVTTFTVVAADDGSLTHQWYRGGTAVPGATTPSLTIAKVTAADAGRYSVAVRSAEGSESRVSALLEIETSMPPVIESQPEPWAAAAGETVRFKVLASGSAPLTYEWRHDGTPLPDGTRSELVLPDVRSSDSGFYSVTVRNSAGETVNHSVQLTVVEGHEPTVVIISLPEFFRLRRPDGR